MGNKTQSRIASVLAIAVGSWMMLVPAFTSVTGAALANILITGAVIALAGLTQLFWENVLPSWVDGLAAAWLLVSAITFDVSTAVAWNMAIGAIIASMLALWDGAEVTQLRHAHQQRM